MQKKCYICREEIKYQYAKDKKWRKVSAAHSICNLKFSIPKEIRIVFHNESNYDYHVIIKELAEEFKVQFTCVGENTGKRIIFIVPIEKEVTKIHEKEKEITKAIS